MAQSSSFDIVSEIDMQEVDNAVNQTRKEVGQRYDFKGVTTTIEVDQKEKKITVISGDEFHLKSAIDIFLTKAIKRGIPTKALVYGAVEPASGGAARQTISLQVGISKENAKMIVARIKNLKLRVQAQIMEDQVRVSGKNKDDLQEVITMLKEEDLSFAMQFVNYR